MSQPRNNLEALQRQIPPQQKSSYFTPIQSPKPSKFKPAKSGSVSGVVVNGGTHQLASFSTPGYGKQRPRPPASAIHNAHSSSEAIDISISSSDTTSPTSTRLIPYKRSSSDLAPALPVSPKRPKITASDSEKESVCSVIREGKGREVQPPPSRHYTPGSPGPLPGASVTSPFAHAQRLKTLRRTATPSRPFTYKYNVHSDLQERTADELQILYDINDTHFHQVRRYRDKYRMRKASGQDPYILEGLLELLENRLRAITSAIAASGGDSEDIPPPPKSASIFPLVVTSTSRTHAYNSALDFETSRLMNGTQVIDDGFGEDDTRISSTSHGTTLVANTSDHVSGAEDVDRSAHVPTTTSTLPSRTAFSSADIEGGDYARMISGPQLPRPPTFSATDEFSDCGVVQQGPASDDELWNQVDGTIEDDSVESVSPDANQPAPMFSAVALLRPPPAETPSEASLRASPHYPEVVEKLRNVFRLKAFRKNQLAAIVSTLNGRDAIVLMPTGGGKSLCFQLPAVCRGGKTTGVTIVVSPLRALMADQVERLRSLEIDVMMLASMDSQDGNSMHELRSTANKPSLVYVTPEKLYCSDNMKAILKGLHARRQLARFVIDEAHLINSWGRDFRASGYAALSDIRKDYPGVPIVALTATATSEALQDIVTALSLNDYVLLSQSFNRPNLRYKVIPKKKDTELSIAQFIKEKYPGKTGIIYCIARIKTEEVAKKLKAHGLNARHFHAGLNDGDRKRIQQQWQNGECNIIVATVAFGMGVDKADVRFVIHFDVPESVDAYCQETGRAGRDGKVADCILYYSYYDVQRRILRINKDTEIDVVQKSRKRQAVHTVSAFCINEIDCRRMLLLNHFTEKFDPASCNGTCDNCASTDEVTEIDLTTYATQFVIMFQEAQDRCMKITGALSLHAFRGTSKQEMTRRTYDTLESFGKGSSLSTDLTKRLFDNLIAREVLSTELEEAPVPNRAPVSYVYLGPAADDFLAKMPSFVLKIRCPKNGPGAPRSKKGPQPPEEAPAFKPADDPVDPFPANDYEPFFDDIEVEPEPREPSPPLLLQAQRLRASPGIEDLNNTHQQCYKALCTLRAQFAEERGCDPQDILENETIQALAFMLPCDSATFKGVLEMEEEATEVHEKWIAFGGPCLNITSKYALSMR
ncbi:hypothetical protein B0F90DRAFT_1710972 [Multifurca ochricompacta]|uniref:DNA 3'-5' helicase n=1 Tax=Multifurca ochricompacta TaxID=376703 RepID=A0AAD4QM18_9AGAM|nr:hypothetical protein B0F90DRAFT_1710972 [Multifurca ochricompacta]